MPLHHDIAALILAGGRATRMGGIAKHAILVEGETILARQLRVLRAITDEVFVSSPVDIEGARTVRDAPAHEGIGPLAGISAGLAATTREWLLVIAGDMPYPSAALISRMLELLEHAGGRSRTAPPAQWTNDLASIGDHAPRTNDPASTDGHAAWQDVHAIGVRKDLRPEPLLSVLRVARARDAIAAMIAARDYKASRLLDALNARYVDADDDAALHNINEPSDIR